MTLPRRPPPCCFGSQVRAITEFLWSSPVRPCSFVSVCVTCICAGITYGWSSDNARTLELNVSVPDFAKANGTLFLHLCVNHSGYSLNRNSPAFNPIYAYCIPYPLTKRLPLPTPKAVRCFGSMFAHVMWLFMWAIVYTSCAQRMSTSCVAS